MMKPIDFSNKELVWELHKLQKESYLMEARLVNFFEIPSLKESFPELLKSKETFIGYFESNNLVGALSYYISSKELTICRVVVHPSQFRKGIAQRLLTYLENNIEEIHLFRVSTAKDNEPAKRLYLKNDFVFVRDMEVAPGFNIRLFEKKLET